MNIQPPRIGPQPWEQVRTRLDQQLPFNNMRDTPYYRDAIYEQFSKQEYARRYQALRDKMREHKLDCMVVPGGPSHWSFGGGMLWLTGHWEWHALCCYVLVPLDGEPTMIYSMGGTHAEAVRRQVEVAVKDVRHSRSGRYADIMVERIRELKLEHGRIGLMEIDPRHSDYLPVNQYNVLRENLPDAELVFTKGFLHELLSIHSAEELDCVRKAGVLCQNAMEAMVARARPGVKEYELRAAAGAAILEGGGDIDFLIIGSTPMSNPAMVFGNPRPSSRVLAKGDIVNMELAAGYRGYTAQIGSPICVGEPTEMVRKFWSEITLPGYRKIIAEMKPGRPMEDMRTASRFFRDQGVQSRPTQCHGIDLVTDKPHIIAEHVSAEPFETVLKPGMVIMAEPNPITADGLFGIFLGHTFIITKDGHECVDKFPLEIAVAKGA
jgi:Xaa-Pro aminopeptidase